VTNQHWLNGEPTELGLETFTCGDCWILAYRLSQLTGWPIMRVGPTTGRHDYHGAKHFAVKTSPYGFLLDVEGVRTYGQMRRRWGVKSIVEAPESLYDEIGTLREESDYPDSWRRSLIMARRLLNKYAVRTEE
jgi:hypothetical protein